VELRESPGQIADRKTSRTFSRIRADLSKDSRSHVLGESKALALAGLTRDTPNPPNGTIVRGSGNGRPTGALEESATDMVDRVRPPMPARDKILAALRANEMGQSNGRRASMPRKALSLGIEDWISTTKCETRRSFRPGADRVFPPILPYADHGIEPMETAGKSIQ